MSGFDFSDEAAKALISLYMTEDVIAQRTDTLDRLGLRLGECVIDIGCGPGFLAESMAEEVGSSGHVLGIDISQDLIEFATQRASVPQLEYRIGDAIKIDEADGSFDVAVCTQVAEYVPEVDRVISEAFRILRTGGRVLFVATDWDAVIWHSDEPARMASVLKSWEAHCAHPRLPRLLCERMRGAGFKVEAVNVFPIVNLAWTDSAYSKGLSKLVRSFVDGRSDIAQNALEKWFAEFAEKSAAGRYFFSSNRFLFSGSKPA